MTQKTYRTTTLPFDELEPWEQCSEIFYKRALELTKTVFQGINRAYPLEERRENPRTEGRCAEALRQAKQHLNFHKKAVADFIPTFCRVIRHVGEYEAFEDRSTKDFRNYMAAQFGYLYQKFVDYAEVLVPEEDVESLLRSLEKVYKSELSMLLYDAPPMGISHYEVAPRIKESDVAEQYGKQTTIDKRTRQPMSDKIRFGRE